uniref:Mucin-1 n=1 Tax=Chrysemys picta bellii TaxID=8478 RepID=A0A8C3IRM4_CHRPI
MTTPPPSDMTTPPPSNTTTPPPGNNNTPAHTSKTTTPLSTSITTPATIHFFLSFRIVNWNFNNSLLDPSTSYYKDLYSKIQSMIVSLCRRRNRGELDLFSSQASYQPTSEYPTYHTYGRFSSPGKKQDPYNDVSSGIAAAGTNAFYANPAMSS